VRCKPSKKTAFGRFFYGRSPITRSGTWLAPENFAGKTDRQAKPLSLCPQTN
jgi:hypothetical protein